MSNLVPGPIFISSGFNRKSTPTNITPAQLDQRYKRTDFNGHDWPTDSPVSRAYDVSNSSTSLIILNNKYGKNSTRLRGYYSGPKSPDRHVDPERHRAMSPRNPLFHTACYDSSSPKFEPTVKSDLEWVNSSHRPPNALIGTLLRLSEDYYPDRDVPVTIEQTDGHTDSMNLFSIFDMPPDIPVINPKKLPVHKARTSVNPKRHASCMATPEVDIHEGRPASRMSLPPNRYFTNSEFAGMSMGEKIYMWSIERIYNIDKMKRLKQEQYRKLLNMEARKGYHGYSEYTKYMRYIDSAKDRSYGTGSPSDKRAKSAHSPRSPRSKSATSHASHTKSDTRSEDDLKNDKKEQTERPKTSLGQSRHEPLKDTKPTTVDTKPTTVDTKPTTLDTKPTTVDTKSSASSDGRRSAGSQRSKQNSPSPNRKSSAKSSRSNSQRSLRSKSGSRTPSAVSAKSWGKTKEDHSDSSLNTEEGDITLLHKEGKDRPKSRLGHPGAVDRDGKNEERTVYSHKERRDRPKSRLGHPGANDDQDSIHSSTLSIKSDHCSTSSDSGVENGKKRKKTKLSSDSSSGSSVDSEQRRRKDHQHKTSNRQLIDAYVGTKQYSKMGSRSSVNSKSSKSSSRSADVDAKNNQQSMDKQKSEPGRKGEALDKDANVHGIPSTIFVDEKVTNDEKTEEEKGMDLETVDKEIIANSKEEENQIELNSSKREDAESSGRASNSEQKSYDSTNAQDEKSDEQNKTKEETTKMEATASIQHGDETFDSKSNEINEDKTGSTAKLQKEESESPTDENDVENDKVRNKLSRQDSFEEDDDDRRRNKDLDKIEY